jgi:hypothetical protein
MYSANWYIESLKKKFSKYPATNSDSASGKSNGDLLALLKRIMKIIGGKDYRERG